jgi:endogenous inhibitor of DNA gyrase (YacG/DUF329 family)
MEEDIWLQSATSNFAYNTRTGETKELPPFDIRELAKQPGWKLCPRCDKPSGSNMGPFYCPYCGYGREDMERWGAGIIEAETKMRPKQQKSRKNFLQILKELFFEI